jgi:hypothetical protein
MNTQRREAAKYVAEGVLSDSRIADMLGVSEKTVWNWRHVQEFIDEVKKLRAAAEEESMRRFAAQRGNRIDILADTVQAYLTIRDERAAWFAKHEPEIPGGKTGHVIRRERVIGLGKNSERITEYVIDTEIRNGLESLGKELGIETGQRTEKRELAGAGGSPLFSIVELAVELTDDDGGNDPADDEA